MIRLDLTNAVFQRQLFALEKQYRYAVLNCLAKLIHMEWNGLYRDRGLRWEVIQSRVDEDNQRLYSLRVTQKMRATGRRNGDFLELLSLHADHDSAC